MQGGDSARVMAPVWLTLSFITEAEGEGGTHPQVLNESDSRGELNCEQLFFFFSSLLVA